MGDARHDAFMRLFLESREALRRYVRRLVRSRETADEVVQEAFLRTYEQRDAVQIPRAFLFSTARNLASDIRRHDRIAATDSVGDLQDAQIVQPDAPLDSLLIADEASRLLKEAVDRLPEQCRAVFTLKVFHGWSYREIAQQLGLAEKTVEKHVARALLRTHGYMRARYGSRGHG
jgi:RNA polymerase sigma-70 factor, ECF subfamily